MSLPSPPRARAYDQPLEVRYLFDRILGLGPPESEKEREGVRAHACVCMCVFLHVCAPGVPGEQVGKSSVLVSETLNFLFFALSILRGCASLFEGRFWVPRLCRFFVPVSRMVWSCEP